MPDAVTSNKLPRIIVIEDDESHGVLIKRMFTRNEVLNEIVMFDNGMDFLKFIETYELDDDGLIIMLDLNLPMLDGYQILDKLRGKYGKDVLPVIVISTTARGSEIELSYSKGCNTFLKKPVSFNDLVHSLESMGLSLTTKNQEPL